jgi:hypothetical protein
MAYAPKRSVCSIYIYIYIERERERWDICFASNLSCQGKKESTYYSLSEIPSVQHFNIGGAGDALFCLRWRSLLLACTKCLISWERRLLAYSWFISSSMVKTKRKKRAFLQKIIKIHVLGVVMCTKVIQPPL